MPCLAPAWASSPGERSHDTESRSPSSRSRCPVAPPSCTCTTAAADDAWPDARLHTMVIEFDLWVTRTEANRMAKKNKKAKRLSSRLGDLAEDLGTFLGSSERKASDWLARQQELRKQLSAIRDKATALLSQLGPGPKAGEQGEQGKKGKKGKIGKKVAAEKKPAKKAARPAAKKPAP